MCQADAGGCRICPDFAKRARRKKDKSGITAGRSIPVSKSGEEGSGCRQTQKKMDTEEYQERCSRRIQIAEPVFANIGNR